MPAPRHGGWRFDRRVLGALAVASVASAIFQLLMIKVAECILGPYNETFALVLSVVLLGLAVGSWAAMRLGLTFAGAVGIALAGTAALLALLPVAVGAYAALYPAALQHHLTLVGLKFGLVLAMMALPAIGFGATIPALLVEYRDVARESGQLLFVSSLANVAGFVLMAFALHRTLAYGQILAVVALLAGSAVLLQAGRRNRRALLVVALVMAALVVHGTLWDELLLYYGHKEFRSTEDLKQARSRQFATESFKGPHDLFAIIYRDGQPFFFINGYISITLTAASEKIVGAVSTMFSPRTDDALVLGVGSGATAGTVGLLFDRTDAVEINRAVLDHQARMEEYNFDVLHQPTVNLIHDDGIHFIKTSPKQYSLILNTVTSPLYFSSAKLYTRDFYEDVVARLRPDGVYTTWIDRKIGDRGVDIILNTLESTFDECWMTYIKSSYYLMVCSNDEIGLHQLEAVRGNETLREYLATRHRLPVDLVPYGILTTDAFRMKGQVTPINRLDRPVLEHHMARIEGSTRLFRLTDRLIERTRLAEVEEAIAPWFAWEPGGFALWADMCLAGTSLLDGAIRRILETRYGDLGAAYEHAALNMARRAGTAGAHEESGYRLYKRERYRAAIDALGQALTLDPGSYRAHYYRGRCREELGEPALAALEFEEALRIHPAYEKAEKALDRVRNHEQSG
jgi:predicted membrane-bound spermidine synthase